MQKQIVIITGATGSGKSKYAIQLAQKINGVIINCDSMQIYNQIPILSAQPSETDTKTINHYLYGYVDIFSTKTYSVGLYLQHLKQILQIVNTEQSDKIPIIVGGTMMYVDAIVNGINQIPSIDKTQQNKIREVYKNKTTEELFKELQKIDKKYANIIDCNNTQRILRGIEVKLLTNKSLLDFWIKKESIFDNTINLKKILIYKDRSLLYDNINTRFDQMIKNGAIEESRNVYDQCKKNNFNINLLPKAIGLNELFSHFDGKISLETAIDRSKQMSRKYAKRQLTWFRNRFQDFEKVFL